MCILLSHLATSLPSASALSSIGAQWPQQGQPTPRNLLALELGPLASLNACLDEWLVEKYTVGATYLVDS